ncbi:hypothetical protein G6F43_003157 [Rhizopus delemar]|nr:hypothetical protein G6F43_003157 [Rhizopus delemar]
MIKARLPVEVREWIKKHVDRDLDWKQIKNLLRLDESRLDQLENNTRFSAMPAALFVKYKDVKNLIDARIFLEEAEEWYIDSTHKSCKSLNNPAENNYLFTIVVRSPVTNKGVPVCFFITDREVLSTLDQ